VHTRERALAPLFARAVSEYFDLAVRYVAVHKFFAHMPPFVTRHRLCDLAFCMLFKRSGALPFMPHDDDFVYFYSRGRGADGGASGVTPTPLDSELAQASFRTASPPVRSLFVSEGGGAESFHRLVVSFVACLRQARDPSTRRTPRPLPTAGLTLAISP
jgi:hypothetical protein